MRLRIWHKMIIGIAIPSIIAIIGGLANYEYITDVQKRQGYEQIADKTRNLVLEVRRNEKNFFHFKDENNLNHLHTAISSLDSSIQNIPPGIIREIGEEDFTLLGNAISKYSGSTGELYKSYMQESMVTEKVREEGRKLEAFVAKKEHASELTTSFILHLRLMEKNYMLFRDRSSYMKLDDALSKLKNLTPVCYECKPYIASIHDLFTTYERSDALIAGIQTTGNSLERITDSMSLRERRKIDSFLTKTKLVLIIALALLITLQPYFVYKTASYIVAPIKRLGEITKKISEGDMGLRAPIREHDETYSLALSFNTMLDKLQLTHDSLEKSMELLKQKQAQLVESEKRASLGLLVSGVAHELNNPLYNISLTAGAMKEDVKNLTSEELDEYADDIIAESKRAHNIVESLLDFARARKSAAMQKLDISKVVKESTKLVANHLRINNITLKQEIPDTPLYINGNQSKLEQIFVSIYTNAIQAMKSNGTLTVTLKACKENRNILVRISDTGPGIPEKEIKNIFEPFFTTKPVGQGTGLGLSVCHSLINEHNGEIEVESTGKGTDFIIKFPQYKETAQEV